MRFGFMRRRSSSNKLSASEHRKVGAKLLSERKLNEAYEHLRAAVELEPTNLHGRINLGVACYMLGRFEEARVQFEYVLTFDQNNPTALMNMAAVCSELGELERAIELLNRLTELHPSYPDAHYCLAIAHCRRGNIPLAIEELHAELQRDPNHKLARQLLKQLVEAIERAR
ncbi:MAG: tetratricopeptide repeat protein [Armatimonadota bacterium]|nr:tetratricopeptide repeat protein [Armatimonadota bacterium]MCX7778291.1 tetratricopeptide repeat protein [Armatimonadota bacterium]MDW8026321.1 tetratricopeptide repeat protein [Armatimonadota bacterium]